MKLRVFFSILFVALIAMNSFSQTSRPGESISYTHYKKKFPQKITDFAVQGNITELQFLDSVHYKYSNNNWHFIRCSPSILSNLMANGIVEQIYFEPSHPALLNDTMRIVQNIDSVHNGAAPLISPFTGKDVIIGYVDTGIDFNHEDFKNDDGTTRVLYYWDHSLGTHPLLTPGKYGYGQVWTAALINGGFCTSLDNNAHGTTVSGAGSGNGNATGTHKGVAPDSDIIIVETDFTLANWTLTVADAIDFIFSMADTLGKPVVVNTSVGSYFGSHDGTDPAAVIIDSLIDDAPGRIVVAAAGNSGAHGKYHVKADVDADTSFCWFIVNPASAFGAPAVYFDLWADTADFNQVQFAFGADNTTPEYDFRGRTQFYNIQDVLNLTTIDSIMSGVNKLAPVEFFAEEVNGVYHIELLIESPDSADYLYRFETFGAGKYDLWSGAWIGASNIKNTAMPLPIDFPAIVNYNFPDTLSTIVSSWACSPKVVTVGNFKNQYDYLDYNGNPYILPGGEVGKLSVNSSKGPTRNGLTKPDVAATGDGIMSACPLWLSADLIISNPSMLALGGQHVRNGGTSMASPVIAGIAALYLEKCPSSTYQDFLNDLHQFSYQDTYTGATPNNAYGYGKVNAFQILQQTNFDVTLLGDTLVCDVPLLFETLENNFNSYHWQNNLSTSSIIINATDTVFVAVTNDKGCKALSDTLFVLKGDVPNFPLINIIGGGLITGAADSILWYFEGNPIPNSNSQYYNPDTTGNFSVQVFSDDGCTFTSNPVFVDLSQIHELTQNEFVIFPNPFNDVIYLVKNEYSTLHLLITDISGKVIYEQESIPSESLFVPIHLPYLSSGAYFLSVYYNNNFKTYKLIKN